MAAHQPRPNEGVLQLGLRRIGQRTVLHDCYAHVPLRVLRPVYLDDTGTAALYLLNPCGGVLGGDTYSIHVTLDAGAKAYLTTPSATQLYATQGAPAQQHIDFTLRDGAVLTYWPEQTIPFADAAFHQHMTVRLGRDAYAFLGDILAPGRLAREEMFAYREFSSSLRVENEQGDLLLQERTRLPPQRQALSSLGLLEGYAYLGTFYTLYGGTALAPTLADALHDLLTCRQRLLGSATTLPYGGLAIRMLAEDHTCISQAMYDAWDFLCQHVLGHPAPPRRS